MTIDVSDTGDQRVGRSSGLMFRESCDAPALYWGITKSLTFFLLIPDRMSADEDPAGFGSQQQESHHGPGITEHQPVGMTPRHEALCSQRIEVQRQCVLGMQYHRSPVSEWLRKKIQIGVKGRSRLIHVAV